MFEECTTLASLNAARTKACVPDADIKAINNAYNIRRQEILSQKRDFQPIKLTPISVEKLPVFCSLPIAGHSTVLNTICLNETGFLV